MITIKQKKYWAVVKTGTNRLALCGGTIPIFWYKKTAEEWIGDRTEHEVVPVDGDELHKLLQP